MASLLSGQTSNGAGSGASHTAECTVDIPDDSVFDGAEVHIQYAYVDSADDYKPVGPKGIFRAPGGCHVSGLKGTYYLRAVVNKAGASTSIDCNTHTD